MQVNQNMVVEVFLRPGYFKYFLSLSNVFLVKLTEESKVKKWLRKKLLAASYPDHCPFVSVLERWTLFKNPMVLPFSKRNK